MAVVEIKIEDLKVHPKNVRRKYEGIEELAQSIKENGIMQNLTVVPDKEEEGKYLVVIGNRRLTAAREAGLETAPCVVVEGMAEKDQIATMLMENMNRKDLTVYEEAEAMQMCFEDFGLKVEEIEEKTGLSKTTINHRLNIAKLDKETLVEKVEDKEFQLSLSDLYALEKVKDVNTRNKILKEAWDSKDLANKARQAAREEIREKNKGKLIAECEKLGINKAPDGVSYYSNGWLQIKHISLDSDEAEIGIKHTEGLYYVVSYTSIDIIKKEKKQKKEKEINSREEEIKEKRAKIKAKYEEMHKDMEDFVRSILEGKVEPPDNAEYIGKLTWGFILKYKVAVAEYNLTGVLMGAQAYKNADEEEKKKATERATALPILYQMIAVAFGGLEYLSLAGYYGALYNEAAGEKLKAMHDILSNFGFSFADEESYKLMNGEHELYEREGQ
nr:MAG TPA: chromosome partitioning protein [Caudoviricetes sp.]